VGDGGQGRGGRQAGAGADVASFVCSGRARGCDAVVEHSSVGVHVRVEWIRNLASSLLLGTGVDCALRGTYDTARKKQGIIETTWTYHQSERAYLEGWYLY
jgi:hypothetical protein